MLSLAFPVGYSAETSNEGDIENPRSQITTRAICDASTPVEHRGLPVSGRDI